MSFFSRLLGKDAAQREALRPLWHRIVEIAREKHWYATRGIADTVSGRFDTITLVLALALIRMERSDVLQASGTLLTELFVADMDGQLRQSGVGDPSVGKHVRNLMATLGGRLGALRSALPQGKEALVPVLERNVSLVEGANVDALAEGGLALWQDFEATGDEALLEGRIER